MRFTDWVPLDKKNIEIPGQPGLFQVRLEDSLLSYPTGKSAMYFYGYTDNLQQGFTNFQQAVLPNLDLCSSVLLMRWMQAEDFEDRFKRHLDAFYHKFGSYPQGNEAILKNQNDDSV